MVIIGGSSGLGFGLAEAVIEEGGNVVVTGSRDETVEKTIRRLREAYPSAAQTGKFQYHLTQSRTEVCHVEGRIEGYVAALADEKTLEGNVKSLFEKIGEKGKIDHIVFTAGDKLKVGNILDATLEEIKQAGMVRFIVEPSHVNLEEADLPG